MERPGAWKQANLDRLVGKHLQICLGEYSVGHRIKTPFVPTPPVLAKPESFHKWFRRIHRFISNDQELSPLGIQTTEDTTFSFGKPKS